MGACVYVNRASARLCVWGEDWREETIQGWPGATKGEGDTTGRSELGNV